MRPARLIALALIAASGAALIIVLYRMASAPPIDASFAPLFQLLGRPTKAASSALTRVMPIGDIDEKRFGDAIVERFGGIKQESSNEHRYVNAVMRGLAPFAAKRFEYRVYMMEHPSPNAFALPGGIIFVTTGLLTTLRNESELAAILAHEIGHIELNHCMDSVRFELLARKIEAESLGRLADIAMSLMLRHTFSKTQENEADEYSFELLKNSSYDPYGTASAFIRLHQASADGPYAHTSPTTSILRDYFSSHPPLQIRANAFSHRAVAWWRSHPQERRYIGAKNLSMRQSMREGLSHPDEWVSDSRHIR